MAKIQRNFRLEPDVDAALSKVSSDSDPKTAIVDRALRGELGLLPRVVPPTAVAAAIAELERIRSTAERYNGDPEQPWEVFDDDLIDRINELKAMDTYVPPGTPANGNPPSESREPTDEDVRIWFRGLDGIDQQKIMVGLGLATASTGSFEAILDQVEAAPEETRRAVLERLLGEQLQGPPQIGDPPVTRDELAHSQSTAHPSWATPPVPPPAPELSANERAIAEEISAEQGLDMQTAGRMARRIVQKRAEAAR